MQDETEWTKINKWDFQTFSFGGRMPIYNLLFSWIEKQTRTNWHTCTEPCRSAGVRLPSVAPDFWTSGHAATPPLAFVFLFGMRQCEFIGSVLVFFVFYLVVVGWLMNKPIWCSIWIICRFDLWQLNMQTFASTFDFGCMVSQYAHTSIAYQPQNIIVTKTNAISLFLSRISEK